MTLFRQQDLLAEARKVLYHRGFDIVRPIGDGGFSTIYLIKSRRYSGPESDFVVKLIDLQKNDSNTLPDIFRTEISALRQLGHPHVIRIFHYFTSETLLYIILEYCPNGDIKDVIVKQGLIKAPLSIQLTRDIVTALKFCHEHGIAHRDIKPSNILIDKYGRAKLADFGLAQCFEEHGPLSRMFAGSLPYLAPEVLLKKPYDPMKADIWGLGITIYEMVTGKLPWTNLEETTLIEEVSARKIAYPPDLDRNWVTVLQAMLQRVPSQRVTCEQILRMLIFRDTPVKRLFDGRMVSPRTMRPPALYVQPMVPVVPALRSARRVMSRGSGVFPNRRKWPVGFKTFRGEAHAEEGNSDGENEILDDYERA